MSKLTPAKMRPSVANLLKRKIGGFVREYERELNRPADAETKPAPKAETPPRRPEDSDTGKA